MSIGTVKSAMSSRASLAGVTTALAVAMLAAVGCNGQVSSTIGSETNWVGACERDDECLQGRCVCGLCTDECNDAAPCPGANGLQSCVKAGSNAFETICNGVSPAPAGICLHSCSTDEDCAGAYHCEADICVPISQAKGELSSTTSPPPPVGAACTPTDDLNANFPGYKVAETNIESLSPACGGGICLVHNFQGRTSCTYGQSAFEPRFCKVPGSDATVAANVQPQLLSRRPDDAVLCTCRCDGPRGTGPFCACPSGYECTELVPDIGKRKAELAGSYCIKTGTHVNDPTALTSPTEPVCDRALRNCGPTP